MRVEPVEIYSDATNHAVMRHPGRHFPGVLVQGDSLYVLCRHIDSVCAKSREALDHETYKVLNELRNSLWAKLNHYKSVLADHGIAMPFDEVP
jgi:hypothetical protein